MRAAKPRRHLANAYTGCYQPAFVAGLERALEKFADAQALSDEAVEDFLAAAEALDSTPPKQVARHMLDAGIRFSPELAADPYRIGRQVLSRWLDPEVREKFCAASMGLGESELRRFRRLGPEQAAARLIGQIGPATAIGLMRANGHGEVAESLKARFAPETKAWYRGLLVYGRLLFCRYRADPLDRNGNRFHLQRRQLIRRIQSRDVKLGAMRSSLATLNRERRALLALQARVRAAQQWIKPEVESLREELTRVVAASAILEQRRQGALTGAEARHQAQRQALQDQVAVAQASLRAVAKCRTAWVAGGKGRE